jgi:hypothetical protein
MPLDATLVLTEKNDIVKVIVEHGPPLAEFQWGEKEQDEYTYMAYKRYMVTVLTHAPTGYYCIFGAHKMTTCPGIKTKVEQTAHQDNWQHKRNICGKWIILVEIETKAPDLFKSLLEGSQIHLDQAKNLSARVRGKHINQQIQRLEEAVRKDPELAIGTSKDFLESVCRTILEDRKVSVSKDEDLPGLVKLTTRSLKLVPDGLTAPHIDKTVQVLLGNLGSIAHQLAEIRNAYGTGHGKASQHVGLEEAHAQLAVGAAVTLAVFLFNCHDKD